MLFSIQIFIINKLLRQILFLINSQASKSLKIHVLIYTVISLNNTKAILMKINFQNSLKIIQY